MGQFGPNLDFDGLDQPHDDDVEQTNLGLGKIRGASDKQVNHML